MTRQIVATEHELTTQRAAELRKPFPSNVIGKLPRSTCSACSKSPRKRCEVHRWVSGCDVCRGSHSDATIHLDYVGHAAVTDRLLAVDPWWTWEPLVLDPQGFPALDRSNNLWIRLTVCGVTRLGVGDGKNAKECIGDAIRNAAMRFGVALDLWSKDELEQVTTGAERLRAALHGGSPAPAASQPRERGLGAALAQSSGDAPPNPPPASAPGPDGEGVLAAAPSPSTPDSSPEPLPVRGDGADPGPSDHDPAGSRDSGSGEESPAPPASVTKAQLKMLGVVIGKLNVADEHRHALSSRLLGKRVTSWSDLSKSDAESLLNVLTEFKDRAALDAYLTAREQPALDTEGAGQ